MTKSVRRFTYGDQFDPKKFSLTDILELCVTYSPDRYKLQAEIRSRYFEGHGQSLSQRDENSTKMAMNCVLSLNAYGLIRLADGGKSYAVTKLAQDLLALKPDTVAVHRQFATYILTELEGLLLARMIENIRARGEQVTLEYLGEEFNDLGIKIPPNSTYISTMREWLALAGVFRATGYEVNWDVIYDLLKVDADIVDELYTLSPEQKHFLLSLVSLDVQEFTPSNKIAKHTRSVYKIRLTTKNLVKDILEPLEQLGLIETQKTTIGRGAKPHLVRLTEKARNEILQPLIQNLANVTELTSADLNRSFDSVVSDLNNADKYLRGIALELLAVWIIRLLGLRFSRWRLRHWQATGGGEVDVLAASDKIIYNRWQIQCKNQRGRVGVDVIAKEVGLTFLTKADVVMVITTNKFASDAVNYANQVNDVSRYYVILLEGDDIQRIVQDKTRIVDILNLKARRTFAKRELGMTDLGDEFIREDEQPETIEELEEAISKAAVD
jgi:site-specific DNA-methyltransferase (cytosine-N4-specific)